MPIQLKITSIRPGLRTASAWFLVLLMQVFWIFPALATCQIDSSVIKIVPEYLTPENIKKFADFMFQQKEYLKAAGEYQRYLYYGHQSDLGHIYFQLGRCFLRARAYDQASEYLRKVPAAEPGSNFSDSAEVLLAATYLLSAQDASFLSAATRLEDKEMAPQLAKHLASIRTLYFLQKQQWQNASDYIRHLKSERSIDDDALRPLASLADRGKHLKLKSPLWAGFYSAIIPGSGKMYADRTFDGLYSLLLVGAASFLAYEGFRDHGSSSGKGWFFSSAATFFYAGNIYGSVQAVRLRNTKMRQTLHDEIQAQLNLWLNF